MVIENDNLVGRKPNENSTLGLENSTESGESSVSESFTKNATIFDSSLSEKMLTTEAIFKENTKKSLAGTISKKWRFWSKHNQKGFMPNDVQCNQLKEQKSTDEQQTANITQNNSATDCTLAQPSSFQSLSLERSSSFLPTSSSQTTDLAISDVPIKTPPRQTRRELVRLETKMNLKPRNPNVSIENKPKKDIFNARDRVAENNRLRSFQTLQKKLEDLQSEFLTKYQMLQPTSLAKLQCEYKFVAMVSKDNAKLLINVDDALRMRRNLPVKSIADFKRKFEAILNETQCQLMTTVHQSNEDTVKDAFHKIHESQLQKLNEELDVLLNADEVKIYEKLKDDLTKSQQNNEIQTANLKRQHIEELKKMEIDLLRQLNNEKQNYEAQIAELQMKLDGAEDMNITCKAKKKYKEFKALLEVKDARLAEQQKQLSNYKKALKEMLKAEAAAKNTPKPWKLSKSCENLIKVQSNDADASLKNNEAHLECSISGITTMSKQSIESECSIMEREMNRVQEENGKLRRELKDMAAITKLFDELQREYKVAQDQIKSLYVFQQDAMHKQRQLEIYEKELMTASDKELTMKKHIDTLRNELYELQYQQQQLSQSTANEMQLPQAESKSAIKHSPIFDMTTGEHGNLTELCNEIPTYSRAIAGMNHMISNYISTFEEENNLNGNNDDSNNSAAFQEMQKSFHCFMQNCEKYKSKQF